MARKAYFQGRGEDLGQKVTAWLAVNGATQQGVTLKVAQILIAVLVDALDTFLVSKGFVTERQGGLDYV